MNVEFSDGVMNITQVGKDDAELLMMALEDLSNRLYKKSNNPTKSVAELEQIKSDKMKVTLLYRSIEKVYDQFMAEKPEFEEVDVMVYNEEVQRLN